MSRFTHGAGRWRRLALPLATVAATVLSVAVPWQLQALAAPVYPVGYSAQGPTAITGGQVEGLGAQNNPVAGAVHTVVAHPTDPDLLWVGTVNGGIWRTNNATAASPTWQSLTDEMPSLSIGALELDPTVGTNLVLVGGVGRYSSNNRVGGALSGLLRTVNGGNTWTALGGADLAGQNISGVAARGSTIVVSSTSAGGGIWRSTDTGGTFTRLSGNGTSGLPGNAAFDLVGDPSNNQRLYAATTGGIFRSDDTGANWTPAGGAGAGTPGGTIAGGTNNIEMAVHNSAGTNAVYAGVVNNGQLAGLFRSAGQGGNWTQLDTPQTIEGGNPVGLQPRMKPGSQGGTHFSIIADRTNANLVYLGGDRQPTNPGPDGVAGTNDDTWPNSINAGDFTGRLFRCDASQGAGTQCAVITHVNANGTAPHADSREMAWDANGDLVETDDGGVYRQSDPATNNGSWASVNGNLQIAEHHSCDYDNVANVIMCGNQDTGVPEQSSAGSAIWRSVTTADGGTVAIDDLNAPSIRYFSNQNFGGLSRRTCDAANNCGNTGLGLAVAGSGGQNLFQFDTTIQFYGPIEVNAVAPNRLVLGTNRLYESTDNGDNITDLTGNTGSGITEALAYGGRSAGIDNPNVLWYGNNAGLSLRTAANGTFTALTAYPGGVPIDLVLDQDDWLTAYVTDGANVYRTADAGSTWSTITGDLASHNPGSIMSIAFVPGSGFDGVVIGTTRGVFATHTLNLGTWAEFGAGIPNTLANEVRYDATDDLLLVGTHGRGAWTVANASDAFPIADLRVTKTDSPDPVMAGEELFYTITVTNDGPDTAFGVVATDVLPDGVTYLSDTDDCTLDAGTNTLTCDLGDMPDGATRSFTIKTRVGSGTVAGESDGTTRIENTVTVTTASVDTDASDNTATALTFVQEKADLALSKLCVPNRPMRAGETAKCTVYVDNYGPSHARNATVTDTHTSEGSFTITSAVPSQGSCSVSGGTVTCNLGTVAAASPSEPGREWVEISITATEEVDIDDVAKVVSSTPDPDISNNQREDTLSFSAVSDLAISKTGPAAAVAGTEITYQLGVTNNGPSTATGVVIRDALPAGVSVVSVSGSGGATCNAGTPGDAQAPTWCSFGTLAPGASRTMSITVKIAPDLLGMLHNDARAYSAVFDPDLANNLATVSTAVTADADVAVTIAATPNPVVAGDQLSYQITVNNNGPSTADDVTLTVPLPAALTLQSTSVSVAGGSCSLQTNTNTVDCQLGDLLPGASAVVTLYTLVDPSTPPSTVITTNATVGGDTPDGNAGNNSAGVNTNVITAADLRISLTSDLDVYKPTSIVHYQITVTNDGLSDALDVVVTQELPHEKWAIYDSNDAGCPPPAGYTFTCSLGTVRAGETATFQLNILIRGNNRTVTQTAFVTSSTPDPWTANNNSTRVVTVK
ncbi:MAG: hypothetical protein ACRDT6_16990 [Micromonosporaceae bacterium]